jgi:hypothetical protein
MGYEDILRSAIADILSPEFESMKLNVAHHAWIGDDGEGTDLFADPVTRRALVDLTKRERNTSNGVTVMTFATLTWLDPIAATTANPGKDRQNPIDPRDKFILPDGGTAPIVQTGGFADSLTAQPFVNDTILGTVARGQ